MEPDKNNPRFKLAADFINHTHCPIFLTGKAGSGKTTFLRYIQGNTRKKCVVVAPTGVAAINAGGVTMHSFFQLPMGPFIPVSHRGFGGGEGTDIHGLFSNMRMGNNKRRLIQELELLIIDEVSMVRADALDAMDAILRHFRKQPMLPFGGVQVLFIGDLYQLPPVAREAEWSLLSTYYKSPFFFDALILQQTPPLLIELNKIYRQSDPVFIDLLNRVRHNTVTNQDRELLNSLYRPGFVPDAKEEFITLCTHNNRADQINQTELNRLTGKAYSFEGELKGEFNEGAIPAEKRLNLKIGSQVMFIKNDKGEVRRFFNGKLATVTHLTADSIKVELADSKELIELEKEIWRNIRYRLNETENNIEEEELGTFTQFPIKLAWAITIHKSQGLSFEKAIIDAGQSFSAGQVYVALSRCTRFDGLVLFSTIGPGSIQTDNRVKVFTECHEKDEQALALLLSVERRAFERMRLIELFNWRKCVDALAEWQYKLPAQKPAVLPETYLLASELLTHGVKQQEVAQKFQQQLKTILSENSDDQEALLADRMKKAILHFSSVLEKQLIDPLKTHAKDAAKQKASKPYRKLLQSLIDLLFNKQEDLYYATLEGRMFNDGIVKQNREVEQGRRNTLKKEKLPIGTSRLETLRLHKEGLNITVIAQQRGYATSTIEGHLAECIGKGELLVSEMLEAEKIASILPLVIENDNQGIGIVKEKLGDAYTFGEIRMVIQHHLWQKSLEPKQKG